MRTGRPRTLVMLSPDERHCLDALAHRSRSGSELARRARIILACADNRPTTTIARRLHVSTTTVCKWKARFLRDRLDGLYDEPRPGTPRKIGDAQIEAIIVRTLEETPRGATHWSLRSMARASGMSRSTVNRIWRAFGLQPHRGETFQLSKDPWLSDKVRDIVGLFMNPPDHALVLCVDGKSQIQALERTQPLLPMRPRQVVRRSDDVHIARHHDSVCGVRREDEPGEAAVSPPTPLDGVSAVSGRYRRAGSAGSRRAAH